MSVFEVSAVFQAVDHMSNIVDNIANVIVGLGKSTVGMAIGFEASAAMMGTAFSEAGVDVERLSDAALAVGKDTRLLGVDASQAAEAITTLGRSGMDTGAVFGDLNGYMDKGAQLGGVLRASLDLAAGSTLSIGEAANLSVQLMSTFGREMETAAQKSEFINTAMDTMVRAANSSTAEIDDMAWALKYVGREAVQSGMSLETASAAIGILADGGIRGSRAGTQLRAVMTSLITPTDKAKDALADLGVKIYDATGTMRFFPDIMEDMRIATMNMTNEQRASVLSMITTKANVGTLTDMVMAGAAGFQEMTDKMAGAVGLQDQMAIRAKTVATQIETLKGNLETLGISIGAMFLPMISELIGKFSELVEKNGPAIETFVGKVTDALGKAVGPIGEFVDSLLSMDPVLSSSIVQLAGLALAVGGGVKVWGLLSGAAVTVAPVLATVGSALSAASLSSLGLTAALGPIAAGAVAIAAPLAAVIALVIAYNKVVQFNKDIQEQTNEVTDKWAGFLDKQVETQTTAIGVADAYVAAQERVVDAYEKGGWVAALFIDKQKVSNAEALKLHEALLKGSAGFDDYKAAVDRVNASHTEEVVRYRQVGRAVVAYTEVIQTDVIQALDRNAFWITTNKDAYGAYQGALRDSRMAVSDFSGELNAVTNSGFTAFMQTVGGTTLQAGNEVAVSTESFAIFSDVFSGLKREAEVFNPTLDALRVSMGATTPFVDEQKAALELLTLAYQKDVITQDEFALAGQRVLNASNETGTGLQTLTSTVDNATGGMYGLGTSIEGLPGKMGQVVNAQLLQAQTAEEMAARAKTAWDTMATNVQTAVGAALTAYKTGNTDMLAEQQRALGELALGQIQQWGTMGQITETQMQVMSAAVRTEFGIMSSDVEIGTNRFLELLAGAKTGGQAEIDALIGFVRNIGTETEAATAKADQALLNEMAVYGELAGASGLMGGQVAANVDAMGAGVVTGADRASAGLKSVETSANTMAAGVEGAAGRATSAVDKIGTAVNNLPSYKEIEIYVRHSTDGKEWEFGSPQFKFFYALQELEKYAATHPINIGVTDESGLAHDIMMPRRESTAQAGDTNYYLAYTANRQQAGDLDAAAAMREMEVNVRLRR